jgi:hypothetical protein
MHQQQISYYRARLEETFPEQTRALRAAKTDEEQLAIYSRIVAEARQDLRAKVATLNHEMRMTNVEALLSSVGPHHDRQAIAKSFEAMKYFAELDDTSQTSVVALNPDLLATLVSAEGSAIEVQVQKLLDGVERLSKMTGNDAIQTALQIVGFSSVAIGVVAGAVTFYQLMTLSGAFTVTCTVAGVVAATVAVVVAIAAFIVLSVLIPIIYFMQKPSVCVVFLINEFNGGADLKGNQISFVEEYNVHGKPAVITDAIPGAYFSPAGTYSYGGFFLTTKRDNALVGTQYGFSLTCNYNAAGKTTDTKKVSFAFGVACPLAFGSNNCYCGFDISAQQAAENTASQDKLSYKATNGDGITLSINCNSGSGSVAYYIATVSVPGTNIL